MIQVIEIIRIISYDNIVYFQKLVNSTLIDLKSRRKKSMPKHLIIHGPNKQPFKSFTTGITKWPHIINKLSVASMFTGKNTPGKTAERHRRLKSTYRGMFYISEFSQTVLSVSCHNNWANTSEAALTQKHNSTCCKVNLFESQR